MRFVAAIATLLSMCAGSLAADAPVRLVSFRDGSALVLALDDVELAFTEMTSGRKIATKLSQTAELRLASERPDERLARVLALVGQLGDGRYAVRERATRELFGMAAAWRELLEHHRDHTPDPEVRVRLAHVVATASEAPAARTGEFDALTPAGGETMYGTLDLFTTVGQRGAARISITRACAARIGPVASPARGVDPTPPAADARTERIAADKPGAFGPSPTRIDFERDPTGTRFAIGADVSRAYVAKGFTLATSIEGAIVSVNTYNVGGPSGGLSCATHQPLWEGKLTIAFHAPGQPGVPAGVHRAGFWVAAVSPGGTALEAYDHAGRLLIKVDTTESNKDFLAVSSTVPIHRVVVVPNEAIDPNYTIDDLVFDGPVPLDMVPAKDRYAVELGPGERLHALEVALAADGKLSARGLTIGVNALDFAPGEWVRVLGHGDRWRDAPRVGACWTMLSCGSVMRAEPGPGGFAPARARDLELAPPRLIALWGDGASYRDPPRLEPDTVAIDGGDLEPTHRPWRLGPRVIELGGEPAKELEYGSAPCLWWAKAPVPAENAGWLHLTSGERIALAAGGFRIAAWRGGVVRLEGHGVELDVDEKDVMALVPGKR